MSFEDADFDALVMASRISDYESQVSDLRQRFKALEEFVLSLEDDLRALQKTKSGASVAVPSEGAANAKHEAQPDASKDGTVPSTTTGEDPRGGVAPGSSFPVAAPSPVVESSTRPTLDEAYADAEKRVEAPVSLPKKRGRPKGSKTKAKSQSGAAAPTVGGDGSSAPSALAAPKQSSTLEGGELPKESSPVALIEPWKGPEW